MTKIPITFAGADPFDPGRQVEKTDEQSNVRIDLYQGEEFLRSMEEVQQISIGEIELITGKIDNDSGDKVEAVLIFQLTDSGAPVKLVGAARPEGHALPGSTAVFGGDSGF